MTDWICNHFYNWLCGLFFALIGYFTEIQGAIHVMWAALLFDLIAGLANSLITKKERFSMTKFFVAIVRAIGASVLVALLYAMDKEMNQKIAASYNIAAWLISGFYVWSASENMDQLTGGRIFGILKGFVSKKIEKDTGINLNDDTMKNVVKILVVALVLLTGCKTTKRVTESTVVKTSEQTELIQQVKTQDVVNVQNDVNSELETTAVTTVRKYSEPGAGGISQGVGSLEHGALIEETTITQTTKKRDSDKSKVEATSAKQQDTSAKGNKESEAQSEKKEVKKTGVPLWQIIALISAFLVVVYFLVKNSSVRIPFLTKVVEWIDSIFGAHKGKTA